MTLEPTFARLVSLATHDMRTPLATVHGFTRTLRGMELEEPAGRYVEMIEAASAQVAELVAELTIAARIESDLYAPVLKPVDTLELAEWARQALGEERVSVSGTGALVLVDEVPLRRGFAALVQAALRHGGRDHVDVAADGRELRVFPVTPSSELVVTGGEYRDLGAAVGVILVRRLGGEIAVEDGVLRVLLPGAPLP